MSIFTSLHTSTIPIPSDPGQSVVIRKLAPKHLEAAQKALQKKSMDAYREMGGADVLNELNKLSEPKKDDAPKKDVDPLLLFDHVTLLKHGIVSWTYADKDPHDLAVLEDVDDETLTLLAREILKLSRPRLFETTEETEQARKND